MAVMFELIDGGMAEAPGAADPLAKDRLRALMDVLGYVGHGGQRRFARDCGLRDDLLSQYLSGKRPLPWNAVALIRHRLPRVSSAYLKEGLIGHPLDPDIEARLLQWERERGIEIFVRPRPPR